MLNEGIALKSWRAAVIRPICKAGRSTEARNYRPISMTPVLSKVMQRLIKGEIIDYLGDVAAINTQQHGFLLNRSSLSKLLLAEDHIPKIRDDELGVDVVYLDFAKTVNLVNHRPLLQKLDAYGIAPTIIRWVKSLLTERILW